MTNTPNISISFIGFILTIIGRKKYNPNLEIVWGKVIEFKGRCYNPIHWTQWEEGTASITSLGFTVHVRAAHILQSETTAKYEADTIPPAKRGGKHMDCFGLINMSNGVRSRTIFMSGNGRIYDPDLGRFISPDPYVQMPDNSQNFNRYSYALNNPLVYTDPSGEWLWVPIVIGAYFGGKAANEGQWNPFKWDLDAETLVGVGIGGALGGLTGFAAAEAGLNLVATMGAPGFGMTSGMVNGAVFSGIASGWNGEAMFYGAWTGGVGGAFSGLAMTGLGASWNSINYGHTGTLGDAVRQGLGHLPGLTYRDWSMSQVIWSGFNLPSAGTMLASASQLVNGALHGQWGSKLVPVGRIRNEQFFYPVSIKNWQNVNGPSRISGYWTAQRQRQYDFGVGNSRLVMSADRVRGDYYPQDISIQLSLNGFRTDFVTSNGSTPWLNVNRGYNYLLKTRSGFSGNWTSPSVNLNHFGRVYRRYGTVGAPIPWWRKIFFGF